MKNEQMIQRKCKLGSLVTSRIVSSMYVVPALTAIKTFAADHGAKLITEMSLRTV